VHRPFHHKAPGGTGTLRHSVPDFSFFHRIQRAKAWAIGHVRCARLSSTFVIHGAGRALPVGSANRMNPNAVGLDPESSFRKGCPMTMAPIPAVALTPVAYFPENYFLENLVVRADGPVPVTTVLQKELWYVPSAKPCTVVSPVLLHTFKHPILGIVEAEPDVIMVSVCDLYHTHESQLARIDFKGWTPGKPVKPEIIFSFDDRARGLNGSCMLGPGVMALADCFAGLIWRVDLSDGARSATARVWLAHDTMAWDPDAAVALPPQLRHFVELFGFSGN